MPAGREADYADPLRVEALARSKAADHADGALRILQRHVGTGGPAIGGQAIEQDEASVPRFGEAPRDGKAFIAHRYEAIAAAGDQQHRSAVRLGGLEHRQRRLADMFDDVIAVGRRRLALDPVLGRGDARAAGGLARPQRHRAERARPDIGGLRRSGNRAREGQRASAREHAPTIP